jgi:mono/diheme cytochrome c family protein
MKERWALAALLVLCVFVLTPTIGPDRMYRNADQVMVEKSRISQRLFTALVRQDAEALRTAAGRLKTLALLDPWPQVVCTNAPLVEQRRLLSERAESMRRAANGRQAETMQAFLVLIRNCVQCHHQIQAAGNH